MIPFLIAALVAGVVIYALILAKAPQPKAKRSGGGRSSGPAMKPAEVRERWDIIKATSQTGAAGLKNAVSDADKLFDGALRSLGLPGVTMADRLKAAKPRFASYSTYDAVWRAHKLRNSLAHDIGFDLVPSQAHEAINDFERGLRELGAL